MDLNQRYWAFLSYSHTDKAWADWLHRALEAYPVPRRLVGRETAVGGAPRHFKPIFRDREDLAADPDLMERVQRVLERSAFLIVICSPDAAASPWVESEIVRFKRLHGEGRVLPVIVAGEPFASDEALECFPQALRFHLDTEGAVGTVPAEPAAADLRPEGDGRRIALLKLLAGMLGCGLDELIRRDAQRRHGQLLAITAASLAGMVLMGGLTAVALAARHEAETQRAQAEGLIEFMLTDLGRKLEPAGRLDLLDDVAQRSMAYYAAQNGAQLDASSLGRRARVLHLMGDLREKRGDLDVAMAFFQQAAKSTAELLARQPDDPQRIFDHAQSVYWLGDIAQRRGQLEQAQTQFQTYKQLADRLVALDPAKDAWRAEAAYADNGLGVVLLKRHHADQAAEAFASALQILQARALAAPRDRDRQWDLAQMHAWSADADLARGRLAAAMTHRLTERSIYDAMQGGRPADAATVYSHAINRLKVAAILMAQHQPAAAVRELTQASAEIGPLMIAQPDVVDYREDAARIDILLARARLAQHDPDAASAAAGQALSLAEALVRTDPSDVDWQGPLLGSARVVAIQATAEQARDADARRLALQPAVDEAARLSRLVQALPHDRDMAQAAAEAELLAGDDLDAAGHVDQARAAWVAGVQVLTHAQADGPDPLDADSQAVMVKAEARLASSSTSRR
ncbi:TIR domain-containing protein [Phenylobacterium sp.]|uniref:TIR domain-containing protein n=1 Tax=Phenylobacterium sp. TaxID=1871053 RepID=UPI002F3E95A7